MRPGQQEIDKLFRVCPEELAGVTEIALRLAVLIRTADPFLQEHSDAVCPACTSVCCVNRHSSCDYGDIIYLSALGHTLLPDTSGRKGDDPCRFLGPGGCSVERPLRPYRCTWFFCSPLLEHMQRVPAPEYRLFCELLSGMTDMRTTLIETFDLISGKSSVWRR